MQEIVEYIKGKYQPLALILYGSYADGSNNANSDFDALVITDGQEKTHDTSVQNGIQLDVFVFPSSTFSSNYDPEEFVQVFDGKIVIDTDGRASELIHNVRDYVAGKSQKPREEVADELSWCKKMLLRVARQDAEGMFRLHWLLVDSLEIYCDVMNTFYFGPKKSLRWMEKHDLESFRYYSNALSESSISASEQWINWIVRIFNDKEPRLNK